MSIIKIEYDKIDDNTAEALIRICPFNAIVVDKGRLVINEACRLCKICVKKFPDIVKIQEEEIKHIDKNLWKGIAVYVELTPQGIHPVSFELIGEALKLEKCINQPVYALILGNKLDNSIEELKYYGLTSIYAYDNAVLQYYNTDNYLCVVENFIEHIKPTVVMFGATNLGKALAPSVAARFKTGLTADCTQLEIKENTDLIQIRPAFGGNIMAQIVTPNSRPQLCTVRYKVFNAPENKTQYASKVYYQDTNWLKANNNVKVIDVISQTKSNKIEDAQKVVAIGRGVKSKEEIEKIRTFAESIGAVLACSRPMVECGFFDNMHQIGLSGKTLKPKLIITIGVSGAIQFVAGMQNSEYIIAINSDKNADIFNVANLGLICDYKEILPRLAAYIKGA